MIESEYVTLNVELNKPVAVGENATITVQEPEAASEAPQLPPYPGSFRRHTNKVPKGPHPKQTSRALRPC